MIESKHILVMASAAMLALASCSSAGERAVVKEEAAQIENAHNEGREAARAFVGRNFRDSVELQREMINAGARRSQYDSLPRCRAAYDSAFISTIRTVRPEIAAELVKYQGRK